MTKVDGLPRRGTDASRRRRKRRRDKKRGRGRVVMLVDNAVDGDSRVQKAARSMADLGWQVFLLGRQPRGRQDGDLARWCLGQAQVRLVRRRLESPTPVHELRPLRVRDPLAFSSLAIGSYRAVEIRALETETESRIARHEHHGLQNRLSRKLWRIRLRLLTRVARPLTAFRIERTKRVLTERATLSGWRDKVAHQLSILVYRDRVWRKWDLELLALEADYARAIDNLEPDIIHANDFRMLGVGARAALRSRERGRDAKLVWDAHEYLPGMSPWSNAPRWHQAQILHEREFAKYADAVVTVSEPLADLLAQDHCLPEKPTVVLNAPLTEDVVPAEGGGVRERCGLDSDTHLLVYCGAAAPQRGLITMIEALSLLGEAHVAFVVASENAYVQGLLGRAEELEVADRVHVLPYVPVHEVVPFLSSATVGVMPAHKWPNHEVSLATKFFEYSHAGLPIVVSNLKAMADVLYETGHGEVFVAEDVSSYVRAVSRVLADLDGYRARCAAAVAANDWSWEAQATVLDGLYERVHPST